MRGHPPSAAAAPLLRRTGRQAFPTPRGATRGWSPDTVCGGRPRDPRGATGREGGSPDTVCGGRPRGPRGATGGCLPDTVCRGTPPRPPASSRAACGVRTPRRDAQSIANAGQHRQAPLMAGPCPVGRERGRFAACGPCRGRKTPGGLENWTNFLYHKVINKKSTRWRG